MTSPEVCDSEQLEEHRDRKIHQTSSELRDDENECEIPIRAVQNSRRLRKPPLDAQHRGSSLHSTLSFSLVGIVALFIISQTVIAQISGGHSASHLLLRRQALADGDSEDATATTTPSSATTTTESNVQPLLATDGTTITTSTPSTTTAAAAAPTGNGRPAKIPPVNFTQVNQLFDAVFEESEVVARWRHMDKQLTDGE